MNTERNEGTLAVLVYGLETDRVSLLSGDVTMGDCRAQVFGELVKLATPVVEKYHCDLFNDATWLLENMPDDGDKFKFYYTVRDWGTHIGTDEVVLKQATDPVHRAYVCWVRKIGYTFYFESTEVYYTTPLQAEAQEMANQIVNRNREVGRDRCT